MRKNYLSRQLIAYIGNKRSLLSLIQGALQDSGICGGGFADLFAGSGSVSRLAKTLGFSVYSNDWEAYSRMINEAYLTLQPQDLEALFREKGGMCQVLETLNALKKPETPYMGIYYSPKNDEPDPDRERMFYTRSNGLKLDAVRDRIEQWYPEPEKAKSLLLALLLYEAATHTNTSGVFKAYHKGFGGYGGDALTRILSEIQLEEPCLYPHQPGAVYEVFQQDANLLAAALPWDRIAVTYLDPPYNQHQYGSNYHILNTLALWDKPEISNDFKAHGKAGIRKDWEKTRSNYCYKEKAEKAFQDLIEKIQSSWIFVSYNTEGIIPLSQMLEILKSKGKVTLFTNRYTKYRGGRQSLSSAVFNLEFLIRVKVGESHLIQDDQALEAVLNEKKLEVFHHALLDTEKLEQLGFQKNSQGIYCRETLEIQEEDGIYKDRKGETGEILEILSEVRIESRQEEVLRLLKKNPVKYKSRILGAFKKIIHRKYQKEFDLLYPLLFPVYEKDRLFQEILKIARKRGLSLSI